MKKLLANVTHTWSAGTLSWRAWAGLIVVPVLVLGLLTWAFASPFGEDDQAPAAVVNQDEPVEVEGEVTPLGRELAANLIESEDSGYAWELTDAENARAGLTDGSYATSVTIPEGFSEAVTSAVADDPMEASRGLVEVEVSASAGLADPQASRQDAQTQVDELSRQVVENHLDQLYRAFSEMHDQLGEAVDGAEELSGGVGDLADGAGELADGSGDLAGAAAELADGAEELAAGTGELAQGSDELAGGLAEARDEASELPEQAQQLAEGARQVAEGNRELADTVTPLANQVIEASEALPSASDSAEQAQELAERCSERGGEQEFCDQLSQLADQVSEESQNIDGAVAGIQESAAEARDAITQLADGSEQVAEGNEALADEAPALVDGIAEAADGAAELNTGIQELDDGAGELASGSTQLADGTQEMSSGADDLAGGAGEAHEGTQEMASELDDGREDLPNYDEDEREHLRDVAANPAEAAFSGAPDFGRAAVVLFVVLALWAAGLATYLVAPAVPASVLASREPSWKLIVRAAIPGASVTAVTGVVITAGLWPVLELGFGDAMAFLGVTLLAAAAFMVLNQALVAIFKRPGRFVSIAVLVLTLVVNVISTIPGVFSALGSFLPTHGAVSALNAVTLGTPGGLSGVVALVVWLVVGSVAMIALTDRYRVLPARELRLARA